MENNTRTVKISLEKAKEWYNSGNKSLREVALQAFKEDELVNSWENIKTFEDACKVLGINPKGVDLIYDSHLKNMYKLQIIRRALNADWEPKLNTETIYYPLLRYYPINDSFDKCWKPVANFRDKENNKGYTLVGGVCYCLKNGLGNYGFGYGDVNSELGLLCCKSGKIARYFSKTFGKLIFDAIYGHHNNYTWV